MRIIFLSGLETLVLDIFAWVVFHLSIGYSCSRIPIERFDPQKSRYQTKTWEKDGEIYQKLFHVKEWKKFIPSGAAVYKGAYEIKHIHSFNIDNITRWLKESCRAEFCHWVMILPGFLFFLWNSVEMGLCMVAYAVLNNFVPIIMQRYNRPRVRKILAQLEMKTRQKGELTIRYEPSKTYSHSYQ